jgi:hypothetical protein
MATKGFLCYLFISPMQERRKTKRVPLDLRVEFMTKGEVHYCETINASHGGFYVVCENQPYTGTTLAFRLSHRNLSEPLELQGAVVHSMDEPRGFGVQITRIQHQSQEAFDSYCDLINQLLEQGSKLD